MLASNAGADSGRPAPADPDLLSPQHDCEFFFEVNATSQTYAPDPNLSVRIDNGSTSRDVVIMLSTEGATSDRSTKLGVRYSIDGGPFNVNGPEFLFSDTTFQTHTNMSIVALGPGSHTIVPGYVIFGSGAGSLLFRCISVEAGRRRA